MSTNIRRTCTTMVNRLIGYKDRVRPILERADDGEELVAVDFTELRRCRTLIQEVVPKIEEKEAAWDNVMAGLPGAADNANDPRGAEQVVYDGYVFGGLHFTEVVDGAREMVTQIDIVLREVDDRSRTGSTRSSVSRQGQDGMAAQVALITAAVAAANAAAGQNAGGRAANRSRLRKLKPPEFHGDPLQWLPFWQKFENDVDSDAGLPDVEKLSHLLEALKGPALRAVRGYPMTEGNYPVVLEVLRKRFGDPEIIIAALNAEMVNMPKAGESAESLREAAEAMRRICSQLTQLGTDENTMLFQARAKIPNTVLIKLIEQEKAWKRLPGNAGSKWTMSQFRTALEEHIETGEEAKRQSEAVKGTKPHKDGGNRAPGGSRNFTASRDDEDNATGSTRYRDRKSKGARAFAVTRPSEGGKYSGNDRRSEARPAPKGRQGGRTGTTPPCLFCGATHWMSDCDKVVRRDERIRKMSEQGRCTKCCRKEHRTDECSRQFKCLVCAGDHLVVFCPNPQKGKSGLRGGGPSRNVTGTGGRGARFGENAKRVTTAAVNVKDEEPAYLMTVRAQATGGNREASALNFLDPGAQVNFIRRKFAKVIGARKVGPDEVMDVYPFGSRLPIKLNTAKYRFKLQTDDGGWFEMEAYAKECMGNELTSVTTRDGNWHRGAKVHAAEIEPDVLIAGKDFWRLFISKREVAPDAVIVRTVLGEALCGDWQIDAWEREEEHVNRASVRAISVGSRESMPESNELRDFWAFENIGVRDDPVEDEDKAAMDAFDKSIERIGKRWTLGWPWKDANPELPSNYHMAHSRLEAILRKLRADPELAQKYHATIMEQVASGVVEEAQRSPGGLEHYLPHHPVVTHKLRIVYDASAHAKGAKSLNQCLYRGPVLLPDLVGMLMRFRLPAYPMLADIEKAFLQIELHEPDREVAKFLWVRDLDQPLTPDNLIVYRFRRVAFGVIASPFLLAATINHHLEQYGTPLAKELARNTYVDNLLMSCETLTEALEKYRESRAIFEDAEMNLREFLSNAPGFMDSIPPEHRLDKEAPKVLGIPWSVREDVLRIDFPTQPVTQVTRRSVLKTNAGIYDPMGWVNPCLLAAKLLFQELWKGERQWDSPVSEEELQRWRDIEAQWLSKHVCIRRRVRPADATSPQIHTFVDASKNAYACSVYLRYETGNGPVCELIFAKSRLRPVKTEVTIPRMELMAMLVGVRAAALVKKELRLGGEVKEYLWGDSKVVLAWINSREHQPKFVSNRLAEIRQHDHLRFGYVNTADNPADIGTRGATPEELQASEIWWHGPGWLKESESGWPTDMVLRIEPIEESALSVAEFAVKVRVAEPETIFDFSRFSSWSTCVRTMARVKRFVGHARKLETHRGQELTGDEIQAAEGMAYRLAQKNLGDYVRKERLVTETDYSTGIIRLKTRIGNSRLATWTKAPILLPKDSPAAVLMIRDAHRECFHAGVDATLNRLLQNVWLPGARRLVKAVLARCVRCKRAKGPTYALPIMPDLPADRVNPRAAFESIGVDYLGPTMTRGLKGLAKTWIVLITCLTTRAVYLEPVWDLSGEPFLQVFRRFVSRRRRPDRVLSDNGTQFRLAARALSTCTDTHKVAWKFIGSLSPWQGGVYERLVALVKDAFKRTLGRRVLDKEEMRTFTAEVEASLNSRPLTFVSTEPDGMTPLRPADFLNNGADLELHVEFPSETPTDKTSAALIRNWEALQAAQDYFWNRWLKEYVVMLREKAGWFHKGRRSEVNSTPKVGEVVLLEEPMRPRSQWTLARIVELETRAGAVRNVKLRLPNGRIWSRPVNKVCPLEASIEEQSPREDGGGVDEKDSGGERAREAENEDARSPTQDNKESGPSQLANTDGIQAQMSRREPVLDQPMPGKAKQRTHGMVTRAVARGMLTGLMCLAMILPALAGTCKLGCAPEGISIETTGRAYWCCDSVGCQFEDNSTGVIRKLTREARQGGYMCNAVCDLPGEVLPPVELHCEEPVTGSLWSWFAGVGFGMAVLLLLAGLLWTRWRKGESSSDAVPPDPTGVDVQRPGHSNSRRFVDVPLTQTGLSRVTPSRPIVSIARSVITVLALMSGANAELLGKLCPGCTVVCTDQGVAGTATGPEVKTEVCCRGDLCFVPEKAAKWQHRLPDDLLVNDYTCDGNFWTPDQKRFNYTISCQAVSECRLIDCTFCTDLIANPECFPVLTLVVYGTWLAGFLACLCCCLSACRELRRNCRCVFVTVWWWLKRICGTFGCVCRRQKTVQGGLPTLSSQSSRNDRRKKRSALIGTAKGILGRTRTALVRNAVSSALVAFCVFTAYCSANDAIVSTARTEDCHREGSRRWCEWNHITTMTLLPAGQPVTLLMKDAQDKVLGTLQFTINALTTSCVPKTEQWTYSYKVQTAAVKRCPGMGACSGDQCTQWKVEDPSPGLEKCEKYPSNNFCYEACSTWWCGCPIGPLVSDFIKACLFYCTYAEPEDDRTFEIFSCPTWENHVDTAITFETAEKNETSIAVLHPGMTYRMANLSVTPLVSQAPAPVMTEHFITDGQEVALAGNVLRDLHCETQEEAELRNCTLSTESCTHCQPDSRKPVVNCQCRDSDLTAILGDSQQRLPLKVARLQLRNSGRQVFAETSYAPVQLLIKLEKLRLVSETAETICRITPVSLQGCYSCTTGGEIRFRCTTDGSNALAEVTCEDGAVFTHRCSGDEEIHTVVVAFNRSLIDMKCRVSCPAGDTEFRLTGELRYIAKRLQSRFRTKLGNDTDSGGWFDFDFGFDFSGLLWKLLGWRTLLAVFVVTVIVIGVVWICARCHPALKGYRLIARAILAGTFIFVLAGGPHLTADAASVTYQSARSSYIIWRNHTHSWKGHSLSNRKRDRSANGGLVMDILSHSQTGASTWTTPLDVRKWPHKNQGISEGGSFKMEQQEILEISQSPNGRRVADREWPGWESETRQSRMARGLETPGRVDEGEVGIRRSANDGSAAAQGSGSVESGPLEIPKECPICYEQYTRMKQAPMTLVCGHTFCKQCICSYYRAKGNLECANCRKETWSSPYELGVNIAFKQTLEVLDLLADEPVDGPVDQMAVVQIASTDWGDYDGAPVERWTLDNVFAWPEQDDMERDFIRITGGLEDIPRSSGQATVVWQRGFGRTFPPPTTQRITERSRSPIVIPAWTPPGPLEGENGSTGVQHGSIRNFIPETGSARTRPRSYSRRGQTMGERTVHVDQRIRLGRWMSLRNNRTQFVPRYTRNEHSDARTGRSSTNTGRMEGRDEQQEAPPNTRRRIAHSSTGSTATRTGTDAGVGTGSTVNSTATPTGNNTGTCTGSTVNGTGTCTGTCTGRCTGMRRATDTGRTDIRTGTGSRNARNGEPSTSSHSRDTQREGRNERQGSSTRMRHTHRNDRHGQTGSSARAPRDGRDRAGPSNSIRLSPGLLLGLLAFLLNFARADFAPTWVAFRSKTFSENAHDGSTFSGAQPLGDFWTPENLTFPAGRPFPPNCFSGTLSFPNGQTSTRQRLGGRKSSAKYFARMLDQMPTPGLQKEEEIILAEHIFVSAEIIFSTFRKSMAQDPKTALLTAQERIDSLLEAWDTEGGQGRAVALDGLKRQPRPELLAARNDYEDELRHCNGRGKRKFESYLEALGFALGPVNYTGQDHQPEDRVVDPDFEESESQRGSGGKKWPKGREDPNAVCKHCGEVGHASSWSKACRYYHANAKDEIAELRRKLADAKGQPLAVDGTDSGTGNVVAGQDVVEAERAAAEYDEINAVVIDGEMGAEELEMGAQDMDVGPQEGQQQLRSKVVKQGSSRSRSRSRPRVDGRRRSRSRSSRRRGSQISLHGPPSRPATPRRPELFKEKRGDDRRAENAGQGLRKVREKVVGILEEIDRLIEMGRASTSSGGSVIARRDDGAKKDREGSGRSRGRD